MKTVKKAFISLLLAVSVLLSVIPAVSAAVTADAEPGSIRLSLNETEDGITLDVYLLNMSAFVSCDVELDYNDDAVRYMGYDHYITAPSDSYDWHYCTSSSSGISADLEFFESTDIYLYRYYFERKTEILFNGADFTVEITTYFNETDSYTDKKTVSIPKEKLDPEKHPEVLRSGDINGDGKIDASDARDALRISVGLDRCFSLVKKYADADGDQTVGASDARLILRTAVGLETEDALAYFLPPEPDENNYYWNYDISYITLTEGEAKDITNVLIRKGEAVKWTSSNPEAVKVTGNGKITALKKGFSCVILECGNEKLYYEVTVKSEIQEKIEKLKDKYPDGYYWNNYEPSEKYPLVTETPCSDHAEGKYSKCKGQCAGFAELLFSEVFPGAKRTKGVTWETVKIGDYVRLKRHHSIFITDVIKEGDVIGYDYWSGENYTASGNYVVVAHCNWYSCCNIQWDYRFYPDYEIDSSYSYTAY